MLVPKLSAVFIYTCGGKYSRKDLIRIRKYIRVNRETGCWEYIGALNKHEYGGFSYKNGGKCRTHRAHRAAYEMATGILIPDGRVVMHKCDNPKCCNPDHLKVGTIADNNKDRDNKNRQSRLIGERNPSAKFNWAQVGEIRYKYNSQNITCNQLSIEYNASNNIIKNIISNISWYDSNYKQKRIRKGSSKLTIEIANKIREDRKIYDYTYEYLSKKYSVSIACICQVVNNKIW